MNIIYLKSWKSKSVIDNKIIFFEKIIKEFNIKINKKIVIYTPHSWNNLKDYLNKKDFIKILYTSESQLDIPGSDYVIGCLDNGNKYIKITNYERALLEKDLFFPLYKNLNLSYRYVNKNKFCCFIVSNPNCWQRNFFFTKLSKYKHIDSLGKYNKNNDLLDNLDVINTIDGNNQDFIKLISEYKFMICFENKSIDYYLTEKIYNCFKCNVVPIYWGNKYVFNIFNRNNFIYIPNCKSRIKQIQYLYQGMKKVIEFDINEIKYKNIFSENVCLNAELEDKKLKDNILRIRDILK